MKKNFGLKNNIVTSIFFHGLNIAAQFLLVRTFILGWGSEVYGEAVAILNLIGWVQQLDFGTGNGLKSELSAALALKDFSLAKKIISNLYSLSLVALLIFIPLLTFVPSWLHLFFGVADSVRSIHLGLWAYALILFNFLFANINVILIANQEFSKAKRNNLFCTVASLVLAFSLERHGDFQIVLAITLIGSISTYLWSTYQFFSKAPSLGPAASLVHLDFIRPRLKNNFKFFVVQINYILLFSTSTYLIFSLFGPKDAAEYQTLIKYFAVISSFANLVATPAWTAFTKAFTHRQYDWCKATFRNLVWLSLGLGFVGILLYFGQPYVFKLWFSDQLSPSRTLSLLVGINVFQGVIINIFSNVLNSQNRINSQIWFGLIGSLLLFPVSKYLAIDLKMGVNGIVCASILLQLILFVVLPYQAFRLVHEAGAAEPTHPGVG